MRVTRRARTIAPARRAAALWPSALCVAALAACGGGGGDAVQALSLEARIAVLEAEIKTRIGPAVCSIDSDCRALPMGSRPCGGPAEYRPYSIRGTDEGALERLAAEHQRLSAQLDAQRPVAGACVVLETPTAHCERSAPLACRLR
jgi:hypothetical protein